MGNSKKVRLSDIAEKVGVSVVSVSKALGDRDGVSRELREKIKLVAAEMGYCQKSSKYAKLMDSDFTGYIGVLIPERFFEKNASFYWNLYNTISKELMLNGFYAILEQLNADDENGLVMPHMVQDKKVDGVILLGQVSNEYAAYFTKNFPECMFLDFYTGDESIDSVTTDNFYSEYVMTKYLISQGHKKMLFVGNFGATTSITDRYMGFLKAMFESDLHTNIADIIFDRDKNGNFKQIELPAKMPTAFVCNCDETASRLITLLKSKGYLVPKDVSVVGFDNYVSKGNVNPPLTTVEVDTELFARTAVDLILKKISGQAYNKGHNVIAGKLIIRDSVKKIN